MCFCLSVGHVRAKTAEPIEMRFGELNRVGPRNHVLDGDRDPSRERGNFWRMYSPLKSIGSLCCGVHSQRNLPSSITA